VTIELLRISGDLASKQSTTPTNDIGLCCQSCLQQRVDYDRVGLSTHWPKSSFSEDLPPNLRPRPEALAEIAGYPNESLIGLDAI
jgi:hypothetical protein